MITAVEERRTTMNTDAQSATLRPYVRSAELDNSFWYMGQLMSALAEGEDTGGILTVHEILFPPTRGRPCTFTSGGMRSSRLRPGASHSSRAASRTPSGPLARVPERCCWWYRAGWRVSSTP